MAGPSCELCSAGEAPAELRRPTPKRIDYPPPCRLRFFLQLVSLLEAPAFAPLRLQLLQPGQHPALLRAVHGLLMLLPQVRHSAEGAAAGAALQLALAAEQGIYVART